ncbi:MAG: trigger factor [Alphaproteobacteria bacterium]
MQVTETLSEGLKREFQMVITADEINTAVEGRLVEMAPSVNLPGFRPGKAPVKILRQRYGKAVLGEAIDQKVREGMQSAFDDRSITPALEPELDFGEYKDGEDLSFTVKAEVLPEIEPADFATFELVQLEVPAKDEDVQAELDRFADAMRETTDVEVARPAIEGDVVVMDFVGKVDGEEFAGGSAEAYQLELGAGAFIPGFEEQLIGVSPGEDKSVEVKFPDDYGADNLAGKDAVFDVKLTGIKEKAPAVIDDELAKKVGMDDLEALKGQIAERITGGYAQAARAKMKRELFDKLDEAHQFEAPPSLIEREFEQIWGEVKQQLEGENADEVREGKTDEELETEYKALAARRVRLGLLLAEIGKRNNIQVSQEDIGQALRTQAANFPGQEQLVYDYYQKNPEALGSVQAPILEEKVVDFILELAKVEKRTATPEELADEDEGKAEAGDA